MPEKQNVIFDSGFMSPASKYTIVQNNVRNPADVMRDVVYKQHREFKSTSVYNQDVDELFRQYDQISGVIKSVDFIESLICAAIRSFDTHLVNTWLNLQRQNRLISHMHKKFLTETLRYIQGGNRTVNVLSWLTLIERNDQMDLNQRDTVTERLIEETRLFIDGEAELVRVPDIHVTSLVKSWLERPGGAEDLLYTLQIIFGKKG